MRERAKEREGERVREGKEKKRGRRGEREHEGHTRIQTHTHTHTHTRARKKHVPKTWNSSRLLRRCPPSELRKSFCCSSFACASRFPCPPTSAAAGVRWSSLIASRSHCSITLRHD